jgi:hypothetical protein
MQRNFFKLLWDKYFFAVRFNQTFYCELLRQREGISNGERAI